METAFETTSTGDEDGHQTALRYSVGTQWLMLAIGLTILACVIAYQGYYAFHEIASMEHQRLQTQARVIASNVERQLEATNLALVSVINDLHYLREHEDIGLANRRLRALSDAMPGIRTMLVLDAEGTVIASNREELTGMNFRTRDYFAVPAKDNNPDRLYVSPPFKTVLGPFVINLARVIPAPNGAFNGVVAAGLDPRYFQALLRSVLYAPDMLSSIIHGDGIRFMLVPDQDGQSGTDMALSGTFFTLHRESGRTESLLTGNSIGNGPERLIALHTVQPQKLMPDKPLYVTCCRDRSAIYEHWRANTVKWSIILVSIGGALSCGLALLQQRQRALALVASRARELMTLRLSLMEYAVAHNLQDLLQRALDEICRLSGSPIGFYHSIDPEHRTITLQAWSTRTLEEFCTVREQGMHYPIEEAGIWADCIRRRQPVVHNDYASLSGRKSLPEGHPPIMRELVVPIFQTERVTAVLGVGNKAVGYTGRDVELLSDLADIIWEITERKRSEEERHRLSIRYQTLQSVARDGIHIIDQYGNLVESNAVFRGMLGYADSDSANLKLNIEDWDAGIAREELLPRIREVMHTPAVFETRHRRRDGTVFDVEISACGVLLDGEWYVYASSRDISRHKELQASLRESSRLLADIFDFLPDATFVVDREMKVIAWNRAMEEMSDVPKERMLGQGDHAYSIPFYGERRGQLLDLIDVDDEEIETKYKNVTRLGGRLHAEAFCPALQNGKGAHVWAIVAPLFDSEGKRIGAIESIRNIDIIKATEANLARSNSELEQFAYVASHDLQEPLRKIAGFTELLSKRLEGTLDAKAGSYMWYINDSALRMRTLINDLLSYSRVMRSTRELADTECSVVISNVLRDLELAVKESDAAIVCGPLPVVRGDEPQLGQLFQNLIGNAVKYRGASPPVITIDAIRQNDEWLFSVADNGIGVEPEYYERIFAIFQRLHTREEYPGTGIGLAVCRKIVERHGGRIWIESTAGAGSTFYFTLPATLNDKEM